MKIALIRLTALGDVILAEPIVRALRARFESAEIHFITEARFAEWVGASFGVDRAIAYDRHGADRGVAGMRRLAQQLPAYDLVIDLQGKLRTRTFARQLRAERRLFLRKRTVVQGLLSLLGHDPPIHDRHAAEVYHAALEPLGMPENFDVRPRLLKPPRALEPQGRFLIGLSPGATHATKRWPEGQWPALADRLHAKFPRATFVLIGGLTDRPLLDGIAAQVKHAPIHPADIAALDVPGLARVLASLDLLISVDTGPAHLAAAFDVPVVALFGPTSTVRWGPRGDRHHIVSLELSCAPCSNMGGERCPLLERDHACMRELAIDRVYAAAEAVLQIRSAS